MKKLLIPFLLFCLVGVQAWAQEVKLVLPVGHTEAIWGCSFSPDNKYVVTYSDHTAKMWETASGKLICTMSADFIRSAQFSPDGKYILTMSLDSAMIWSVNTGKLLKTLGGAGSINSAFYSSKGQTLLTSSMDNNTRIWNTSDYSLLATTQGYVSTFEKTSGQLLTAFEDSKGVSYITFKNSSSPVIAGGAGDYIYTFSPVGKYAMVGNIYGQKKGAWVIETQTGKILESFADTPNLKFSPDDKYYVNISVRPKVALVTESSTGNFIHILKHENEIVSCAYSLDGKYIATGTLDGSISIWSASSGSLIYNIRGHSKTVMSITFSADSRYFLSTSDDLSAKVWEVSSGNIYRSLEGSTKPVLGVSSLANTNSSIVTSDDRTITALDYASGTELFRTQGKFPLLTNGNYLSISKSKFNHLSQIYNATVGQFASNITTRYPSILRIELNPEGALALSVSEDNTVRFWEVATENLIKTLQEPDVEQAAFIGNEKFVTSTRLVTKIWSSKNGNLLHTLAGASLELDQTRLTDDGKRIVTHLREDFMGRVWDTSTGKLIFTTGSIDAISISGKGKYAATYSTVDAGYLKIWDALQGTVRFRIHPGTNHFPYPHQFSPDERYLVTYSNHHRTIKLWETTSGKELVTITGDLKHIIWENNLAIVDDNSLLKLIDLKTTKEILSWIKVGDYDWVVTHPSGLFDASPGAMDKLYFVQGLDIIDFNQLKERYYEPGLWKKIMAGEELRNVEAFTKIELPPDIELSEVNAQGMLTIKATNRGGGIGEISVLINGKEVIQDARPKGSNSNAPNLSIQLPVTKFAAQFWPGDENFIAVKAWNAGHWVVSRGKMVTYKAPKKADIKPAIHVIACGISDYTGDELDLKFAAKDAEDVAQALTLGAKKLFGTEAAYVHTLTTSGSKETWPTKANIINTFKNVSSTAKSTDVIVLYLAGHGITWGGQDGDFYYLTQDAYTGVTSAYNDPAIREKTTLSSAELVELFKLIPAQKQVMIVDACGSGKAVDNLIAKRDIPSSTLRALDRMKDRTGMHIITGCAADAVSYEASQFGQGILTYSLLEGIRGAALREEKFVDVNQLFQYAQERVPLLVAGVGGVQTPQVFSPYGAQSFDIGEVSTEDKKKIPIAKVRPVFVRSSLINKNTLDDNLQLGKLLDEKLNDIAARGVDAELIFVNVQDYPDGCKLSGIYEQVGDSYKADVKIKCGDKEQKHTIMGSSALDFVLKAIDILKH